MKQGTRAIIAAGLLLVFGVVGLIPTLATANDGARFVLPARHGGDAIDYEQDDGAFVLWFTDLIVEQPMAWKDEDGVWHRADLLTSVASSVSFGDNGFSLKLASLVDGETWASLAASNSASSSSVSSMNTLPLLNNTGQESTNQEWGFTPGWTFHPCGVLNGLQGADEWSEQVVMGGDCDDGGPATFTYDRASTWKGEPAMVYVSNTAPSHLDDVSGMELTFAPGIPYPVIIRFLDEEGPREAHLEGFHRGEGPLLYPVQLDAPTPLPVVTAAATDRYGPDLGAVDASFPIEEALDAARTDPSYSDVRDFMDEHPDWRVNLGDFEDEGDRARWLIGLSTPEEGMAFTTTRTPNEPFGADLVDTGPQWSYDFHTWSILGGPAPALEDMPQSAPFGESVADAWRVYAETDAAPNAASFDYGFCHSFGCSDYTQVQVGSVPVRPSEEEGGPLGLQDGPQDWEGEAYQLAYDSDGVDHISMVTSSYKDGGGLLASPEPGPVPDEEPTGISLNAPTATAGIIAGLFAALVFYFWPVLKTLPGFALFTRLQKPDLLGHPSRQVVMGVVEASPGLRFSELQRRTGLAQGTLSHHVRHLVDAGLVREKRFGGFTCYFAPADATKENTARAEAVQSDGARTVMDFIHGHPGTTARRIAASTGLAVGTVGYHVKRLRDAGLIDSERDGRQVRLHSS